MIKVVYHRKYHRLTVQGHANSGDGEYDLVCASASILTHTLANFVENLTSNRQAQNRVIRLDEGDAEISCSPKSRYNASVTLVFDAICAGFEVLAFERPENITYEMRL